MKILHIDTEKTWRGGENQIRLLVEGLLEKDIKCFLAAPKKSEVMKRLSSKVIPLQVSMKTDLDFISLHRLVHFCRLNKIEIIDAQTARAHTFGLMIKMFLPRIKLVVHRRVDYVPRGDFLNRMKYLSLKVDRYVAISEAIKNVLINFGIEEKIIRVVKSAVDRAPFVALNKEVEKRKFLSALGIDPLRLLISNAAHMTPQKGHDVLIRALRILQDRGINFHCLIAGDGVLRPNVEKLIKEFNLSSRVTLLGVYENIPQLLSATDIFAMPSNFEGLGTAILEAIYAGCPVVATRVGGIPEIIKHGLTGLLSKVGDGLEFANNLEVLSKNQDFREKIVRAGNILIEKEFSLSAMVNGNHDIYKECVSN